MDILHIIINCGSIHSRDSHEMLVWRIGCLLAHVQESVDGDNQRLSRPVDDVAINWCVHNPRRRGLDTPTPHLFIAG
jgi:hypothetical protein